MPVWIFSALKLPKQSSMECKDSLVKNLKIPQPLKKMNEIFQANGFEAYLVGGAVRDMIRG